MRVPLTIETDRLLLRQFRGDDLDVYHRICSDPEVMRYVGGQTFTRAEAWRHIAYLLGHWQMRGYGLWALEEKSSGRLLGRAGLYFPENWPGLEVGWLLERSAWGRGFASEAGRASIDAGFQQLQVPRLCSVIHVENAPSMRVAERLGERFERNLEVGGFPCALYVIDRPKGRR